MRKFDFIDFKNNTSSFELCTAAFPDSEEKQIKIPHDQQLIGFAVLPNDDESVKWIDFIYCKPF